jgi:hypothetical protein
VLPTAQKKQGYSNELRKNVNWCLPNADPAGWYRCDLAKKA